MTTTELIKILQDNEKGGISHKSRHISVCINGQYMPNPHISISGTGDGICGPEIDLDIKGDWFEQEPCNDAISKQAVLEAFWKLDIEIMPSAIYAIANMIEQMPYIMPQSKMEKGESCEDVISRQSIKQKLKGHHDFFIDIYGCFSNLPPNYKSRVDEIANCIAMVVNEPSVIPQPYREESKVKDVPDTSVGKKGLTSEDAISRQAAIEAIEKIFPADSMRNDYTQGITCGAALAEEYIKQLPSVTPQSRAEREEPSKMGY